MPLPLHKHNFNFSLVSMFQFETKLLFCLIFITKHRVNLRQNNKRCALCMVSLFVLLLTLIGRKTGFFWTILFFFNLSPQGLLVVGYCLLRWVAQPGPQNGIYRIHNFILNWHVNQLWRVENNRKILCFLLILYILSWFQTRNHRKRFKKKGENCSKKYFDLILVARSTQKLVKIHNKHSLKIGIYLPKVKKTAPTSFCYFSIWTLFILIYFVAEVFFSFGSIVRLH